MAFIERFLAGFDGAQILEMVLRLVIAAMLGGIVGIERSRRFKDAGVRTHSMVSCASALLMIISKYGFLDLVNQNGPHTWNTDPARIAAGIVTGVSFLGAGIIYRDKQQQSLKGLTTAAGVWCVAGIGMATGAGMYFLAVFASLFIVLLQFIMHRYPIGNDKYIGVRLEVVLNDNPSSVEKVSGLMKEWGMLMEDCTVERDGGKIKYTLDVKLPSRDVQEEINNYITSYPEICSVELREMI